MIVRVLIYNSTKHVMIWCMYSLTYCSAAEAIEAKAFAKPGWSLPVER